MHLQRIIVKLVMLAMLVTVTLSPVSATPIAHQTFPNGTGCHSAPNTMSCCDNAASIAHHQSTACDPDVTDTAPHTEQCCTDHNCHANNVPFAILTDINPLSIPSSTQEFPEPIGTKLFFHELLLRPPMSA